MRVLHYSYDTEQAYGRWVERYLRWHRGQPPEPGRWKRSELLDEVGIEAWQVGERSRGDPAGALRVDDGQAGAVAAADVVIHVLASAVSHKLMTTGELSTDTTIR